MDQNRRSLLVWAGRCLGGLVAGGATLLGFHFSRLPRADDLGQRRAIGPLSRLPVGSSTYLADVDIYVFHEPEGLYALSGKCTHLGCSVKRQADGFACPCHGARFDSLGNPRSGPAPRPLSWHRLVVDARQSIWLYLDQRVPVNTWTRI